MSVDCSVPPLSLPWSNITVSANGLAVTRGIELGIGTPNQIFSLRPSTTLNNTRISNVLDCGSQANTSCIGAKGGVFDNSQSSTFAVSLKSRWNGSVADAEAAAGAYVYFNDVLNFQANTTVQGYPLVENADLASGPESGLPLGQNSSFLAVVTEVRVAPSSLWGLDVGDRSLSPRDGKLIVGGYDQSRFTENLSTFPIGDWTQQPCPLQVTVKDLRYISGTDVSLTLPTGSPNLLTRSKISSMIACVEPFQQRFTFLPSTVKNLIQVWALENYSPTDLTFPSDSKPSGHLEIGLDNGYITTIPNNYLFTPKRGSDENGQYVITNSSITETGIAYNVDDSDEDTTPILGGLYLTFNYLIVDYENNQFQMAPTVQETQGNIANITTVCRLPPLTVDPDASPSHPAAPSTQKASNKAAIGSGTAGAFVGLAMILCLCYFIFRKRRRDRRQQDQIQSEQIMTGADRPFLEAQVPNELALTTAPTLHELPDRYRDKKLPTIPTTNLNSN